jgi:hypothetical protein
LILLPASRWCSSRLLRALRVYFVQFVTRLHLPNRSISVCPPMKQTAISIVKRLREAGHTAHFNGGCVRDMVRGVEPQDIDIATSATPEQVQALFAK